MHVQPQLQLFTNVALYFLLLGTGKKAKIEKSSVKQSKKVNFEDTEKEGSQIIEGGRVTPSLVKVCSADATLLSLMFWSHFPHISLSPSLS
jgi:hypothetical protein